MKEGKPKREIRQHTKPERVYRELDEDRAKLLYAVLKLQDQDSGATQKRLAQITEFDIPHVSRLLQQLAEGGYIIESKIFGSKIGSKLFGKDARIVYEVDALNVTFRDSAVILLELLKRQEECGDPEGKVEVGAFVDYLMREKKLKYFVTDVDLFGDGNHPGKIDLLAENGEHIERVTPRFIKPRLKVKLQKFYLELVAAQIPLEDIGRYRFEM